MKIAIVRLSALGDIIQSMSVLQFIKKQLPDAAIDWFCDTKHSAVLEFNPDIDTLIPLPISELEKFPSLRELLKTVRFIRKIGKAKKYDQIIDMQGLIKSAIAARLLGKNVHGYDRRSAREPIAACFYKTKTRIGYGENTIMRNAAVCSQALGFQITAEQLLTKKPYLYYHKHDDVRFSDLLSSEKPNLLFIIGSTWESRNYPKEQLAKLAGRIDARVIVCWGTEQEHERALWLQRKESRIRVTPKLSLNGLKHLIASVDIVIGNDTGPTHMAWALNTPSITLFGPTPVSRILQTPLHLALNSSSKVDPKNMNRKDYSIAEITPEQILETIRKIFAARDSLRQKQNSANGSS